MLTGSSETSRRFPCSTGRFPERQSVVNHSDPSPRHLAREDKFGGRRRLRASSLLRVDIRALDSANPDDVATYRSVRLRALSTNPEAFGSTYARELAFDDATWRTRVGTFHGRPGAVFLASDELGPTGIAGVGLEDPSEHGGVVTAYLWGMWVDPRARRSGTSGALVAACIGWGQRTAVARIVLDVVRTNAPAIALYARFAFVPTGRVGGLPSDPCENELQMCLLLSV